VWNSGTIYSEERVKDWADRVATKVVTSSNQDLFQWFSQSLFENSLGAFGVSQSVSRLSMAYNPAG
jgi:hypothetical protein